MRKVNIAIPKVSELLVEAWQTDGPVRQTGPGTDLLSFSPSEHTIRPALQSIRSAV